MTVLPIDIRLSEWQEANPDNTPDLRGLSFEEYPEAGKTAIQLAKDERIEVTELRSGLSIKTNSHVGMLRLGPIRIVVKPKIPGGQLLRLLRYTFGLRDLGLQKELDEATLARFDFQDVIIHQLAEEAGELIRLGLRRQHILQHEWRSDPRGRFDFAELARSGRPGETRLPCHHHDRSADCLVNRVLLAGLRLATNLAQDPTLASRVRHLVGLIEDEVGAMRLDMATLISVRRSMDRLTRAYEPSIRLIETLVEQAGPTPEGARSDVPLSGFLFDMNRFFERLLDRFLSENLPDSDVRLQHRLTDMFLWETSEGGTRRRPPSPRPDYIVMPRTGARAVLDAKYRDLGALSLPREMLYQLTMYSFCHNAGNRAAILYPSVSQTNPEELREERLHIRDPVSGRDISTVTLRAVPIPVLADLLVERPTRTILEARQVLAQRLAFGR